MTLFPRRASTVHAPVPMILPLPPRPPQSRGTVGGTAGEPFTGETAPAECRGIRLGDDNAKSDRSALIIGFGRSRPIRIECPWLRSGTFSRDKPMKTPKRAKPEPWPVAWLVIETLQSGERYLYAAKGSRQEARLRAISCRREWPHITFSVVRYIASP